MNVTRHSPLLKWYLPEELEMLLCGSKVLDWNSLQTSTNYDGGFTAGSEYIKNFWKLFDEFTEEQKKQLLKFTTGTDRCPHGGLAEIKLTISRNGPDTDRYSKYF
jgi:ubiquitin-protein ligase E3 A